jgi:hypothetical protein
MIIKANKQTEVVVILEPCIKGYLDPAKKVMGGKAISFVDNFQLNCKIR